MARKAVPRHHPRREPGALTAPAGICAGGGEQSLSLVRCGLLSKYLLSGKENGEPLASLWRMSPCGRLGPVFPMAFFILVGVKIVDLMQARLGVANDQLAH